MTKRRPFSSRFLLALLVMLAISFQGVAPAEAGQASSTRHHAAIPDAGLPCHDMASGDRTGDDLTGGPAFQVPKSTASLPCCVTLACGLLAQALPPEVLSTHLTFSAHFNRPPGLARLAPGVPDAAWRPPSFGF